MGLEYEVKNHPPVYTIEEMESYNLNDDCVICKNLFVRDAKGKQHYLIILDGDKQANLKELAKKIGSTSLSFASAKRLRKYLGLEKGSVSPFGIFNDKEQHTIVVVDKDLRNCQRLGVHPNINTSTVVLPCEKLEHIIKQCGNKIIYVDM